MTPNPYGPWTTSLDAGSRLGLNSFWKRRLEVLPTLLAAPAKRRRGAVVVALFLALVTAAPLLALSRADSPTGGEPQEAKPTDDKQAVAAAPAFGAVIERTVNDDGHSDYLIDFDTGKLFARPEDPKLKTQQDYLAWIRSQGIDAEGEVDDSYRGLVGLDMIAIPTHANSWNKLPGGVVEELEIGDPGTPVTMDARTGLPATYFIQTREGARGVLQIIGVDEDNKDSAPDRVRIRYKLIADPSKREVFRPQTGADNRADWSPLFPMGLHPGEYMLMAHVPVGDKFPVKLKGSNKLLFNVELVKGSDQALSVKMIPPAGEPQRLWLQRDEPVDVVVGGEKYTLTYPTTQVAAKDSGVTGKAMITVSCQRDEQATPPADKKADAATADSKGADAKAAKKKSGKKKSDKKAAAADHGSDLLKNIQRDAAPLLKQLAADHGYALAEGRDLHRVAPPFPAARMEWYRVGNPGQAAAIPRGPDTMFFSWEKGALHNRGMQFGAPDVQSILESVAGIYLQDIDGAVDLRKKVVPGDWVVRAGASNAKLVAELEDILNRELSMGIRLRFAKVERDVYVARGEYKFMPIPGQPTVDETQLTDRVSRTDPIQVFGAELVPDSGSGGGTGDFKEFCDWLGRWVHSPIVSEVDAPPRGDVTWSLHGPKIGTQDAEELAHNAKLVLGNVTRQTGLTFSKEKRPVTVLMVEHAD